MSHCLQNPNDARISGKMLEENLSQQLSLIHLFNNLHTIHKLLIFSLLSDSSCLSHVTETIDYK